MGALLFLIGLAVGSLIIWFYREGKIKAAQSSASELRTQLQQKDAELNGLRSNLNTEQQTRVSAEIRLEETKKNLEEQKKLLSEAEEKLKNTFKALSSDALKDNNQAFLNLAKQTLENLLTEAKGDLGKRQQAIEGIIKPLKESLDKYETQIRELERARANAYGSLKQQLGQLNPILQQLQKETTTLTTVFKTSSLRAGNWGQMTLRRLVEIIGMSEYCDFEEQPSLDTEEGRKRPDLIVKLPGGRIIIVDAKAPRAAYMESLEAPDENFRKDALRRHAQAVRNHMLSLCSKAYWNQFTPTLDLVVMFLPGESLYNAALEYDRALIEDAIKSRVMISTPSTLATLLMTVAYDWRQQQLAENAQKIAEAGKELFERVCKFAEHLNAIRDSLNGAVKSYNDAVGSWELRVIPGARKLKGLGAASAEQQLPDTKPVEKSLREIPDLSEEK